MGVHDRGHGLGVCVMEGKWRRKVAISVGGRGRRTASIAHGHGDGFFMHWTGFRTTTGYTHRSETSNFDVLFFLFFLIP